MELEEQEEDIWVQIFSSAPSFKQIEITIISMTNLDLMVFFQEIIYLEQNKEYMS